MSKPRIFVGSSVEGLHIVDAIVRNLDYDFEVVAWNNYFEPGMRTNLQQLLEGIATFQFAVLVFTPDDPIEYRGDKCEVPRDNVVFELGMFLAKLGPDRTFIVHNRKKDGLKLPTDLAGVSPLTFKDHSDGNLGAALRPACGEIKTLANRMSDPLHNIASEWRPTIKSYWDRWRSVVMQLIREIETSTTTHELEAMDANRLVMALDTLYGSESPASFTSMQITMSLNADIFSIDASTDKWTRLAQEKELETTDRLIKQFEESPMSFFEGGNQVIP